MKSAHVWIRPTSDSPACRYSYNPERSLAEEKQLRSDCGMWITPYSKRQVLPENAIGERCTLCSTGQRCAGAAEQPEKKKTRKRGRRSVWAQLRMLPS